MKSPALEDVKIPIKIKIAALWTSVMFCYIYGDYFELYTPGKLQSMLQGQIEPLGPATQGVLLGTSVMMAIPSLMVFLSIALRPIVSRWLNIAAGLLFTAIMLLIVVGGAWHFYIFFALIEIALTSLVVWHAWHWPRPGQSAA